MNDRMIPQPTTPGRTFSLAPRDLTEAMRFAELMAASDLVPKDYKGKPGNCLLAVQMGAELGLAPMQAVQGIAVINGRPAVWGDAMLAIVQAHPAYERHKEWIDGENGAMVAYCEVKRKGSEPHLASFSVADARQANLFGKDGPWKAYPKRMLQMRARAYALRNQFADALRGLQSAEEAQDMDPATVTATPVPEPQRLAPAAATTTTAPVVSEKQQAPPVDVLRGAVIDAGEVTGDGPAYFRLVLETPTGREELRTRDQALYEVGATIAGTDHLLDAAWKFGRAGQGERVKVLLSATVVEPPDDEAADAGAPS